jgi:Predicted metal-binding, possibly nucleic acid-binding protein
MQFHMQEMMAKGLKASVDREWDVGELLAGRPDVIDAGPLRAVLEVKGHEGFVTAEGELSIRMKLACSRCLSPVEELVTIPFEERFKPAEDAEDAGEDESEDDEDMLEVTGERLDLQPYAEEALLLFMPFAPLCSSDCKGLCPNCGTNLNEETCGCTNERIDPRFAALKDLFKET